MEYNLSYVGFDDLQETCNRAKDEIIRVLKQDELLATDSTWGEDHAIVLMKKGAWGKLLEKIFPADWRQDAYRISVVKVENKWEGDKTQ